MSLIDDLIAEHCPDGVDFVRLRSLGRRNKGTMITAGQMKLLHSASGPISVFAGGNTTADVELDALPSGSVISEPSIIVKSRGYIGFTYCARPFTHKNELWSYTIARSDVDQKFVYYYLLTRVRELQAWARATSVKLPQLSVGDTDDLRVPLPPLPVQRAIVNVLDAFAALEVELEAELEARRRQYEHYRGILLSASGDGDGAARLRDVADIVVGYAFKSSSFSEDSNDPALVRGDNVGQGRMKRDTVKRWRRVQHDGLDRYELSAEDVVLAMDRPWIPAGLKWARIGDSDLPALLVQRVARLRARPDRLDQRFLGCVISSPRFTSYVLSNQTGNTVPHISGTQIGDFSFSLPALAKQRQIAVTLEHFDALVNDLSIGLPAELKARRQQYEYYRDKLLTFEEAPT